VVLQELHSSLYFCQTENTALFDLADPIRGRLPLFFRKRPKKPVWYWLPHCFEKRAAGLYHNTAVVFEKDGSIAGKYRKMHIPDDPAYYEKFYFTPAIWVLIPLKLLSEILAFWFAGINGIPKLRG
jgi:N-carbamoylputrescine amidase